MSYDSILNIYIYIAHVYVVLAGHVVTCLVVLLCLSTVWMADGDNDCYQQ